MRLKETDTEIRFVAPRSLDDKLTRLARAEFSSKAAVLRRLLAQAADKGVPA
jgi:hypothetical protein